MTTALSPGPALRTARLSVSAIFMLNGLALANWLARIPDVKAAFAMSDQLLGLVLLCAAIGALVAQPTVGWLIRYVGSRRMTIGMGVAFCLSLALPGLATSVPALMLALVVLGACNGGLDVAMNAQAALVEERYNQPIMNSFHGLWSVGGLIGAGIAGIIVAQGLELRTHLLAVALLSSLAMGVAVLRLLRDGRSAQAGGPHFALLPRALLLPGLIAFGVLLCEGAVADWGAVYLREGLGSAPGLAATGFAVFSLLMAVGRLSGDRLALRLGTARMIRGGGVLVALGIALAVLGGTPVLAIGGFGLVGAGLACSFPLLLSAAARTPGVTASTAIAAVATAGYTGFLVGPPLLGSVAEAVSLRWALGLLSLIGVLMVACGGAVERHTGAAAASQTLGAPAARSE